jgi:hypothetical protein
MKIKPVLFMLLTFTLPSFVFAASAAEGSGTNRGAYLAGSGYIIPARDIRVEHYVAQQDYDYPLPENGDLSVTTGSGIKGDNAYIQIGLKGKKTAFADLPPLNICFLVDRSGSMTSMMPWVKDSFHIFIDTVRNGDFVSLADMNDQAQELIPPTRIRNTSDRNQFNQKVDAMRADGATNIYGGMLKSYEILEKNYNPRYVNRVILITDGMHNFGEKTNKDILDLASGYRGKGIDISLVIMGVAADTGLMTDIAVQGGGSSRFISDHDEMVKIFRTELDRMLVPAARDLRMRLVLSPGVQLKETWGYDNYIDGATVHYSLPTIHNGDYETIAAEILFNPSRPVQDLGNFYLDYTDLGNTKKSLGPYPIRLDASGAASRYIADPRVREAEGFISLCRGLTDLAERSGVIGKLEAEYYALGPSTARQDEAAERTPLSPEAKALKQRILDALSANLKITGSIADYLRDISESLGGNKYTRELEILKNYEDTFTRSYDAHKEDRE